ncbi:MAG: lysophospholipid acyltransferase family protein [Candidatus Omnitrophota bacterium]
MFNYCLYRLAQAISLTLPLKAAYALAVFLSDIYHAIAFRDRRAVTGNLEAIFPQKNAQEISGICKKLFNNFAKYLVDFFRFERIDADYLKKNIRLKNLNYIDESLTRGSGALLVTAHLGNWELGGVVISMLGYPFLTVALPHKTKMVDTFFNSQRQSKGMRVLPLGSAAKGCLKGLKGNEVLALVGDREFAGKGVMLDFFGKPASFPAGPAALALQAKTRIIPGFMLRNADDSFDLVMDKPLEYTPCGNYEKDLKELTIAYKSVFEDYIRRYPEQWYMFRRFWKGVE